MPILADLFSGFATHRLDTSIGAIVARVGGKGPPLLLLHGYPQTHVMWHRVAPMLAERFTLVLPDLPGYGSSVAPEPDPDHAPYSKRAMARVLVEVMDALGHPRVCLAGHDRGGRVGYRLALDCPERVHKLAVLDIVPTHAMWHGMNQTVAYKAWHWAFLALPAPFPETLIGKDPIFYLEWKMASWAKSRDLSAFDPRALAHYREFFCDPLRIRATCEDYRAGHTTDLAADEADKAAGKQIACPLLALWGDAGIPGCFQDPLTVWRTWGIDVSGAPIQAGHFLCEENPQATGEALLAFFRE
jgi:haloacetate dehalogenase